MGFGINQSIWDGPVQLEFKYDRDHTKTIRYRCDLEKHAFHFYAPLFMLRGLSPGKIPDHLEVTIGRSKPISPIGFGAQTKPLCIKSDLLEYEFKAAMGNSKRYDLQYQTQIYALYIPSEIFGTFEHPRRIYVQIVVPAES